MWSEHRLAVAECRATLLQPCRVLQLNVATMSRARRQQRCHSKNGTWQRRCHNVNVFVGVNCNSRVISDLDNLTNTVQNTIHTCINYNKNVPLKLFSCAYFYN